MIYQFLILTLFIASTLAAVKNPSTKPVTVAKSKPSVKPVAKPTVAKPVAKPIAKPIAKPVANPTKTVAKPSIKPVAKPTKATIAPKKTPTKISPSRSSAPSLIPTSAPSSTSAPSTTSAPTANCYCDKFDTLGNGPNPILACYNQSKYFEYFGVYVGDDNTNIILKNPNFPSYNMKSSTDCESYFNNANPLDETGFAYMNNNTVYSLFANDDFARTYQMFTCPQAVTSEVRYIASVVCPSNLQYRRRF